MQVLYRNIRPLYIFDLDGTLALVDHRRPILADKSNPNRWDDFYNACIHDEPNKPVIHIFNTLLANSDIVIFSGRSQTVYEQTITWLKNNTSMAGKNISDIKMRPTGDNTPDEILKKKWYEELLSSEKERLICVFDDRQKVVNMWRSIGVTCMQVASGDF